MVHSFLKNLDLLVFLLAKAFQITIAIFDFPQQVVNLDLFRLDISLALKRTYEGENIHEVSLQAR